MFGGNIAANREATAIQWIGQQIRGDRRKCAGTRHRKGCTRLRRNSTTHDYSRIYSKHDSRPSIG